MVVNHFSRHNVRELRTRRGVTMVEAAAVLPILLLVLFAMLDLGMAAMRYNSLAEAARRIARFAITHGSQSPEESSKWGPNEYTGTIADGTEIVDTARKVLIAMRQESVQVNVTWPDNDNSPRDRVHVDLHYRHEPLISGLFVWGPIDLRATTTMQIVN